MGLTFLLMDFYVGLYPQKNSGWGMLLALTIFTIGCILYTSSAIYSISGKQFCSYFGLRKNRDFDIIDIGKNKDSFVSCKTLSILI